MTLEKLKAVFTATGLPVTFRAWPADEAPALPYLCWTTPYNNNFAADNRVYAAAIHVQLELYTELKEPTTEGTVERTLNTAGIYWTKTQDYLEDERCYMTIYEMEV